VHTALGSQRRQVGPQALHCGRRGGDQEHHDKLAAQVDHAAVFEIAVVLGDEACDFVDQPWPVGAESGKDRVLRASFHDLEPITVNGRSAERALAG
jgi:hypothetical protein